MILTPNEMMCSSFYLQTNAQKPYKERKKEKYSELFGNPTHQA